MREWLHWTRPDGTCDRDSRCNRSRDKRATSVFIKSLSDKNEWVRLEAAKGLANLPDPNAGAPLTAVANNPDESRDVRIAATDALKYYRTIEIPRVLSGLLADGDFSVAWQRTGAWSSSPTRILATTRARGWHILSARKGRWGEGQE